jgi:hypothetical protein
MVNHLNRNNLMVNLYYPFMQKCYLGFDSKDKWLSKFLLYSGPNLAVSLTKALTARQCRTPYLPSRGETPRPGWSSLLTSKADHSEEYHIVVLYI